MSQRRAKRLALNSLMGITIVLWLAGCVELALYIARQKRPRGGSRGFPRDDVTPGLVFLS
jgi:hypothetical protein